MCLNEICMGLVRLPVFLDWTCHKSRKSDKWRKILMLNVNVLLVWQPLCYWELAIRFMGNRKTHLVCPWRLLFKGQDDFRGFSPTLLVPFVLSHSFSPRDCEVYINTDEASITYCDWIRVAAFAALHSGRETVEQSGQCCYAVPFQLWTTEKNNILVLKFKEV